MNTYLIYEGDFMVQLMDLAEAELCKKMDEIAPSRLESLLELALRCSTANADPYKDDLRLEWYKTISLSLVFWSVFS